MTLRNKRRLNISTLMCVILTSPSVWAVGHTCSTAWHYAHQQDIQCHLPVVIMSAAHGYNWRVCNRDYTLLKWDGEVRPAYVGRFWPDSDCVTIDSGLGGDYDKLSRIVSQVAGHKVEPSALRILVETMRTRLRNDRWFWDDTMDYCNNNTTITELTFTSSSSNGIGNNNRVSVTGVINESGSDECAVALVD